MRIKIDIYIILFHCNLELLHIKAPNSYSNKKKQCIKNMELKKKFKEKVRRRFNICGRKAARREGETFLDVSRGNVKSRAIFD